MDDDKLLDWVRKYPVIYNIYHPKYLDNKHKNTIWRAIADDLKQTEDTCKKRWANIRDQFKKTLNKRKRLLNGCEDYNFKRYKHEKKLKFLIPYINTARDKEKPVADDSNIKTDGQDDTQVTELLTTATGDSEERPAQLIRKRRRLIPQATKPRNASNAMIEFLKHNERTQNDPIDAFFNGLAATVKKFSPYYQHIAKGKIFAIVQGLEWQQLSTANSSYNSPISDSSSRSAMYHEFVPIATMSQTSSPSLEVPSTSVKLETPPEDPIRNDDNQNIEDDLGTDV